MADAFCGAVGPVQLPLCRIVTALALAITLIGIPFAWAHLKLVPLSLWPIG